VQYSSTHDNGTTARNQLVVPCASYEKAINMASVTLADTIMMCNSEKVEFQNSVGAE